MIAVNIHDSLQRRNHVNHPGDEARSVSADFFSEKTGEAAMAVMATAMDPPVVLNLLPPSFKTFRW